MLNICAEILFLSLPNRVVCITKPGYRTCRVTHLCYVQMAELPAPNDITRVNKLVETLVAQLTQNQETITVLKHQIEILKNEFVAVIRSPTKALFSSDKEHTREHMQLVTECQALKRENYALNELLDAYEQGLSEIMTKIRTFMHDTTSRTLQLHKHYRAELSRQEETQQQQQKSYLDLQAGLYRINALIREAYATNIPEDPVIEALQTENNGLREMLRLSYRKEANSMSDTLPE